MRTRALRKLAVTIAVLLAAACGGGGGGGEEDSWKWFGGPKDAIGGGADAQVPEASGTDAPVPEVCTPYCGEPDSPWECGDDGCGASCGECDEGQLLVCLPSSHQCVKFDPPQCEGRQCGPDGMGGNCGVCEVGLVCNAAGMCALPPCVPDCTGKECGDDGCGGECGPCPQAAPTCADFKCTLVCEPDCLGKECGDDGCGGECGPCPQAAPKCVDGLCEVVCQPYCGEPGNELSCGDDGCGGECGTCPPAMPVCQEGFCVPEPVVDGCSEEAKQIFVVSESGFLLRFEPDTKDIIPIGPLDCGVPWTETPYSMSVDRNSFAWVLYSDGSLWKVDTEDASCSATGFVVGQLGFEIFGMGFSTDSQDSSDETLYIAGGPLWDMMSGGDSTLGSIDTETLTVTSHAPFVAGSGLPELTGNRSAELWGFFPHTFPPRIARIDKMTAAQTLKIDLPANMFADVQAWAFANWGGDFYIFFKSTSEDSSGIWRVMDTGEVVTEVEDTGYVITGAGVSTCAPVE